MRIRVIVRGVVKVKDKVRVTWSSYDAAIRMRPVELGLELGSGLGVGLMPGQG
jgi:hypothetical protein